MNFETIKTLVKRECTRGILKPYANFRRDADQINESDKDRFELRGFAGRSIIVSFTRAGIVTIHLFQDGIIRNQIRDTRGYIIAEDDESCGEGETSFDDFCVDLRGLFSGLEIPDLDDTSDCDCRNPRV